MVFDGIILAGGQSRRMGSDKGLVSYKGKQLVKYAIELLTPFCENIVISANNPQYSDFGLPVIPDEKKDIGPAGGLLATLSKSRNRYSIVVSCDMPHLNSEAVNHLIRNVKDATCYIPKHNNGIEPLFGVYHRNFIHPLLEAVNNGNYKLKSLFNSTQTFFVDFNNLLELQPSLFMNFNSLSDLNC